MPSASEYLRDSILGFVGGTTSLLESPFNLCKAIVHGIRHAIRPAETLRLRTAVITGASDGIGKEIAMQAQKAGIKNLLIMGRDMSKLQAVCSMCRIYGIRVEPFASDLSTGRGIQAAVSRVRQYDQETPGGVDIVISCAGMTMQNAASSVDTETISRSDAFDFKFIDQMTNVNFLAMAHLGLSIVDRFKERKRGQVVLISSINGLLGPANQVIYNANKAAVLSLARDLHVLLKEHGIHVSVVTPGFISYTNMTEPQVRFEGARIPEFLTGDSERMAEEIWKGIHSSAFLITYPISHFLATWMSYVRPPTGWLSSSKATMTSGLISTRMT